MLTIILSIISISLFLSLGFVLCVYFLLALVSSIQSFLGGAPFMPLETAVAEKMLELAQPQPNDVIYDLGCGDARHLIMAYFRYQTQGVGIEIAVWEWFKAWCLRRFFGLELKIKLYWGNFKKYNISTADIVFLYLLESSLRSLKNKLLKELRPGVRVVTARFKIPDWKPVQVYTKGKYPIYLYIIK